MGVDVSAYVEKKNKETGKWELVTKNAISSRLKYVIKDYSDLPRVKWDDVSEGLQKKFPKDEDGNEYVNFHVTTLDELERQVDSKTHDAFTKLNMVVKALGALRMFNDDGMEMDWSEDHAKDRVLTYPVNRILIEDVQYAFNDVREIGQLEAFDLFTSEYISYGDECRIILVVC